MLTQVSERALLDYCQKEGYLVNAQPREKPQGNNERMASIWLESEDTASI